MPDPSASPQTPDACCGALATAALKLSEKGDGQLLLWQPTVRQAIDVVIAAQQINGGSSLPSELSSAAYAARASEAAALERAAADRKLKAAAAAAAKERDRLSSVIKDPTGKKNKEAGDAALREGRFKEATVHFAAGLEAFGVFEEVSFVEDDKEVPQDSRGDANDTAAETSVADAEDTALQRIFEDMGSGMGLHETMMTLSTVRLKAPLLFHREGLLLEFDMAHLMKLSAKIDLICDGGASPHVSFQQFKDMARMLQLKAIKLQEIEAATQLRLRLGSEKRRLAAIKTELPVICDLFEQLDWFQNGWLDMDSLCFDSESRNLLYEYLDLPHNIEVVGYVALMTSHYYSTSDLDGSGLLDLFDFCQLMPKVKADRTAILSMVDTSVAGKSQAVPVQTTAAAATSVNAVRTGARATSTSAMIGQTRVASATEELRPVQTIAAAVTSVNAVRTGALATSTSAMTGQTRVASATRELQPVLVGSHSMVQQGNATQHSTHPLHDDWIDHDALDRSDDSEGLVEQGPAHVVIDSTRGAQDQKVKGASDNGLDMKKREMQKREALNLVTDLANKLTLRRMRVDDLLQSWQITVYTMRLALEAFIDFLMAAGDKMALKFCVHTWHINILDANHKQKWGADETDMTGQDKQGPTFDATRVLFKKIAQHCELRDMVKVWKTHLVMHKFQLAMMSVARESGSSFMLRFYVITWRQRQQHDRARDALSKATMKWAQQLFVRCLTTTKSKLLLRGFIQSWHNKYRKATAIPRLRKAIQVAKKKLQEVTEAHAQLRGETSDKTLRKMELLAKQQAAQEQKIPLMEVRLKELIEQEELHAAILHCTEQLEATTKMLQGEPEGHHAVLDADREALHQAQRAAFQFYLRRASALCARRTKLRDNLTKLSNAHGKVDATKLTQQHAQQTGLLRECETNLRVVVQEAPAISSLLEGGPAQDECEEDIEIWINAVQKWLEQGRTVHMISSNNSSSNEDKTVTSEGGEREAYVRQSAEHEHVKQSAETESVTHERDQPIFDMDEEDTAFTREGSIDAERMELESCAVEEGYAVAEHAKRGSVEKRDVVCGGDTLPENAIDSSGPTQDKVEQPDSDLSTEHYFSKSLLTAEDEAYLAEPPKSYAHHKGSASDFWGLFAPSTVPEKQQDGVAHSSHMQTGCHIANDAERTWEDLKDMRNASELLQQDIATATEKQLKWEDAKLKLQQRGGEAVRKQIQEEEAEAQRLSHEVIKVMDVLISPYEVWTDTDGGYMKTAVRAFALSSRLKELHRYQKAAELKACAQQAIDRYHRAQKNQLQQREQLHWNTSHKAAATAAQRSKRSKEALRRKKALRVPQVRPTVCLVCDWGLEPTQLVCERCGHSQELPPELYHGSSKHALRISAPPAKRDVRTNQRAGNSRKPAETFLTALAAPEGASDAAESDSLKEQLASVAEMLRSIGQHAEADEVQAQLRSL